MLSTLLLPLALALPPADTGAAPPRAAVRPGIEVLVEDSLAAVRGKRLALLGNHTAVDRAGRRDVDRLRAAGLRVVALFSPEHGFQGSAAPGAHIATSRDSATGLPIYSLYGRTVAPAPAMLDSLDVILVDLQDAGARYYTYISTAIEVMKAAAPRAITVMILDRPNPIGGAMHGNVLAPEKRAFVGSVAVPMRHGLTLGELARAAAAERGLPMPRVIPASGWRPAMYYDETQLPFLPPSPNLRSVESLVHYPGTCLFEGANLSLGKGTDAPFEQIGAAWLDVPAVLAALPPIARRGVRFEAVTFTPRAPSDGRWADTLVQGIRLRVTDRTAYDPVLTSLALLQAIHARHAGRLVLNAASLDRLGGGPELREIITSGAPLDAVAARWAADRARWLPAARAAWVYAR